MGIDNVSANGGSGYSTSDQNVYPTDIKIKDFAKTGQIIKVGSVTVGNDTSLKAIDDEVKSKIITANHWDNDPDAWKKVQDVIKVLSSLNGKIITQKAIDLVTLMSKLNEKHYFDAGADKVKIMEGVLADNKYLTLDAYLNTDQGKAFDKSVTNLFKDPKPTSAKIKDLELKLYSDKTVTYGDLHKMFAFPYGLKKEVMEGHKNEDVFALANFKQPETLPNNPENTKETEKNKNDAVAKKVESFMQWVIFAQDANAATLTDAEKTEDKNILTNALNNGRLTDADRKKLHISDKLFELIRKDMELSGKGSISVSSKEFTDMVDTIHKYAEAAGLTDEEAYKLYNTSPNFTTEDLDVVAAERDKLVGQFKDTSTLQSVIDTIKEPTCQAAVKNFIINDLLKNKTNKDPSKVSLKDLSADDRKRLCARISFLPLASSLTADQQKIFGIDNKLKQYTDTELTEAKIEAYLGIDAANTQKTQNTPNNPGTTPPPAAKKEYNVQGATDLGETYFSDPTMKAGDRPSKSLEIAAYFKELNRKSNTDVKSAWNQIKADEKALLKNPGKLKTKDITKHYHDLYLSLHTDFPAIQEN